MHYLAKLKTRKLYLLTKTKKTVKQTKSVKWS